jgi:hypothetical protein
MNRILANANLQIVDVDNEDQLNEAVSILKQSPVLALNTEFDSMHHYDGYKRK